MAGHTHWILFLLVKNSDVAHPILAEGRVRPTSYLPGHFGALLPVMGKSGLFEGWHVGFFFGEPMEWKAEWWPTLFPSFKFGRMGKSPWDWGWGGNPYP